MQPDEIRRKGAQAYRKAETLLNVALDYLQYELMPFADLPGGKEMCQGFHDEVIEGIVKYRHTIEELAIEGKIPSVRAEVIKNA